MQAYTRKSTAKSIDSQLEDGSNSYNATETAPPQKRKPGKRRLEKPLSPVPSSRFSVPSVNERNRVLSPENASYASKVYSVPSSEASGSSGSRKRQKLGPVPLASSADSAPASKSNATGALPTKATKNAPAHHTSQSSARVQVPTRVQTTASTSYSQTSANKSLQRAARDMDLDALTSSVELPAGLSASLHLQENAKRAVGGTRDKAEGEGKKDSARETKGKQKEEPTVQEKEKKAKGRAKKDSKPALPKNKVSASSGRPSVEALAQAAAHLDEKVLSSVNQSMAMELCNEPILCHPEAWHYRIDRITEQFVKLREGGSHLGHMKLPLGAVAILAYLKAEFLENNPTLITHYSNRTLSLLVNPHNLIGHRPFIIAMMASADYKFHRVDGMSEQSAEVAELIKARYSMDEEDYKTYIASQEFNLSQPNDDASALHPVVVHRLKTTADLAYGFNKRSAKTFGVDYDNPADMDAESKPSHAEMKEIAAQSTSRLNHILELPQDYFEEEDRFEEEEEEEEETEQREEA